MRISDWSSDVCSSDLVDESRAHNRKWREWLAGEVEAMGNHGLKAVPSRANFLLVLFEGKLTAESAYKGLMEAGYAKRWLPGQGLPNALRDRKRVVWGKSVSGSVDLGGGRKSKKKKK